MLPSLFTQIHVALDRNFEAGRFAHHWCDDCDYDEIVQITGLPIKVTGSWAKA